MKNKKLYKIKKLIISIFLVSLFFMSIINAYASNDIENNKIGLKNIEVDGYALTPKFDESIYYYTLDITDKKCTSLKVTAIPSNPNSNVTIIGADNIQDGENLIDILVESSEENDIKIYQIIVKINKNNLISNNLLERFIIAGIIVIVIIIIIIVIAKRKKRKKGSKGKHS